MEKISYENLIKTNKFDVNMNAKDFSKYKFWHYTSYGTMKKIIDNGCFIINSIDNMNDRNEAKLYPKVGKNVFCLCLCCGDSENIPLWYMYAGITGKGVSIGITPKVMLNMIRDIEIYKCDENNKIKEKINNLNYELFFGFVFYENFNNIFYRNKKYEVSDFKSNNFFTKQYPWHYEREFRIVIKLKNIKSEKIAIKFDKAYLKKMTLKLAPESKGITKEDTFINKTFKKIDHSKLRINMDLLRRNAREIEEYCVNKLKSLGIRYFIRVI